MKSDNPETADGNIREGEEHVTSDFIYRDRLFQEAQMYTRLKAIAQDREYTEMYRALTYMRGHQEDQ